MATWTRNAYPGEMEAADRLTWYETIGIKDLFASITQDDTSNNGTDIFKTVDGSVAAIPQVSIRYLKADYSISNKPVLYQAYVGSSITSLPRVTSPTPSEDTSPIYIDTMIHGDLTLVRFCYEYVRNHVVFIFFNDEDLDGATKSVVLGGQCNAWNLSTNWKGFFDQSGVNYNHKSNIDGLYLNELNKSYCSKIVVEPLVTKGCDMGLYLLDGGSAAIPYNTDFVVDNTQFYHIGYGLCLKMTT